MTANWHPDPTGEHELRYWDGRIWTEHVADQGIQSISPLPTAPPATQQAEQVVQQQVEETVADDPYAARTEEKAAEAVAASAQPVAEEPVAAQPVAEQPVVEEPVAEQPVAEESVAEEPTASDPVTTEPVESIAADTEPAPNETTASIDADAQPAAEPWVESTLVDATPVADPAPGPADDDWFSPSPDAAAAASESVYGRSPLTAGPIDDEPYEAEDYAAVEPGPIESGPIDSGPIDSGLVESGPVQPEVGPYDGAPSAEGPAEPVEPEAGPLESVLPPVEAEGTPADVGGPVDDLQPAPEPIETGAVEAGALETDAPAADVSAPDVSAPLVAPVPDPAVAAVPPVVDAPAPEPVLEAPAQVAPAPVATEAPVAAPGISGDLIDGRFAEVQGAGATLQNNRLLRVRVGEPFMARQGAMVAYQGDVSFAYQGGGAAKFLKKAVTGEGLSLMRVEGAGDVFLADTAKHVHVLQLTQSGISVNGANVLAFSSSLEWNVERVKGGSIAAGGLFNTTLRGTGWVAITTDGEPVVLNAGEAPTYADTNAVVAWSADLQTSLKTSVSAGALIGRGSGEAIQVSFAGQGFVIVQPSEGYPAPATSSPR